MKKLALLFGLLIPVVSFAQQYSIATYKIAGGGGTSANGQFTVSGSVGQHDASGAMTGGSYAVNGGFWGSISVVQTTGAPVLAITRSGNNIIVSWPASSTGWTLQQTPALNTGTWAASGLTISDDGTNKSITLTSPAGNLFFRLSHP